MSCFSNQYVATVLHFY